MKKQLSFTAIIEHEGDGYTLWQGKPYEEGVDKLTQEAIVKYLTNKIFFLQIFN